MASKDNEYLAAWSIVFGLLLVVLFLMFVAVGHCQIPEQEPEVGRVLEETMRYLGKECIQENPCGIEEMTTWESKEGHRHYNVFILVAIARDDAHNVVAVRRVLVFTAYKDGKLTVSVATLEGEKET